ncbi:class I SAM-dependent methyltransferase [Sphingomonas sp. HT-1]|uniref:class I SAM-dependent methyltransferase n=1 Tax=unclassified Sphingomonas TaxID=196159 RepID=UPI0002F24967|nr:MULTISPECIES: class I SAM-dependent methyltransferase [unclassified Sphingomonas]
MRRWSRNLPRNGAILDIGCGTGWPIATTLAEQGFAIFAIDPAPAMLAAFRQNLPDAAAACESAEESRFFDRRFNGAIAIGLMFLLPEAAQRRIIQRVAQALHPGGRFLFSAPQAACEWDDILTGRRSRALGATRYHALLAAAGLKPLGSATDEGQNHYFEAMATVPS